VTKSEKICVNTRTTPLSTRGFLGDVLTCVGFFRASSIGRRNIRCSALQESTFGSRSE